MYLFRNHLDFISFCCKVNENAAYYQKKEDFYQKKTKIYIFFANFAEKRRIRYKVTNEMIFGNVE
jgi:hypothetical protein